MTCLRSELHLCSLICNDKQFPSLEKWITYQKACLKDFLFLGNRADFSPAQSERSEQCA